MVAYPPSSIGQSFAPASLRQRRTKSIGIKADGGKLGIFGESRQ
jgi:hypothetical protein